MPNVLENWKKECFILSSPLNIKRELILDRTHIDSVYNTLADFFGLEYFNLSSQEKDTESKTSWIHSLLVAPNHSACIAALFEVANLIIYLKTLRAPFQREIKSLFKSPRQLRDRFFEIYTFRLLDDNNIQNEKNPKDGLQELEATCIIEGTKYLVECRKIYSHGINVIEAKKYLLEKLHLNFLESSKGIGFIGTMKLANSDNDRLKQIFTKKLSNFLDRFKVEQFNTIDYHDIDEDGELSVVNYDVAKDIEVERDFSKYSVVFKVIPPPNTIPGVKNYYAVELKANHHISQRKLNQKLFSVLKDKINQHSNSKYSNKIFFIDSETIPDFEFPIFRMDSMFEEKEIELFVNSLPNKEIFCFIRREYLEDIPKVKINVFGKDIDGNVKKRLENLKTNFDYHIEMK